MQHCKVVCYLVSKFLSKLIRNSFEQYSEFLFTYYNDAIVILLVLFIMIKKSIFTVRKNGPELSIIHLFINHHHDGDTIFISEYVKIFLYRPAEQSLFLGILL